MNRKIKAKILLGTFVLSNVLSCISNTSLLHATDESDRVPDDVVEKPSVPGVGSTPIYEPPDKRSRTQSKNERESEYNTAAAPSDPGGLELDDDDDDRNPLPESQKECPSKSPKSKRLEATHKLFDAVNRDDRATVRRLLEEKRANVNATSIKYGCTPLALAYWKKNDAMIGLLLNYDVNVDNVTNALFDAICERDLQKVELFISKGADINAQSAPDGVAPLHLACRHYNKSIVEFLLNSKDIMVNIEDNKGYTPLDYANRYNRNKKDKKELIDLLKRHDAVNSESLDKMLQDYIATRPYEDVIDFIDKNGINVARRDYTGYARLEFICQHGHYDLIKEFLKRGVRNFFRTPDGFCFAHLAAKYNLPQEVLQEFVKNNVRIDEANYFHQTTLHIACFYGSKNFVKFVIDNKLVDLNANDGFKKTPLDYAIEKNHKEIIDLLRQHCARTYDELHPQHK